MKNLFDAAAAEEIKQRIQLLQPDSKALWGKMRVDQMLAHCNAAFMVPLSEKPLPRMFVGMLLGWMMKAKLYNDEPWKKNLPTAPSFVIKDARNFEVEQNKILSLVDKFFTGGPEKVGKYPHPFFGKFTAEQWGKSMYKHLDHHLQQFGA
jgi:hypothetical protein